MQYTRIASHLTLDNKQYVLLRKKIMDILMYFIKIPLKQHKCGKVPVSESWDTILNKSLRIIFHMLTNFTWTLCIPNELSPISNLN